MSVKSKFFNKKNILILILIIIIFGIAAISSVFYIYKEKQNREIYIESLAQNIQTTALELARLKEKPKNDDDLVSNVVEQTSDSVVSINYIDNKSKSDDNPIGSGVVVSEDGIIITNKHVVDDEKLDYEIIFQNGTKYPVNEIIRDKVKDLALIKIDASNLKPIKISDSKIKLGQKAIAVGNALGYSNSVSAGIISGLNREADVEGEVIKNLIQTDAAINLGNSGGALLNANGELIGINTAKSVDGENVGFAIPVSDVSDLITKYKSGMVNKNSAPAFLGITFEFLNLSSYVKRGLPIGPMITGVVRNSPAFKAGLKNGDIIISVDGTEFSDETELATFIKSKYAGDKIDLKVYRNGDTLDLNATLIELK